MKMGIILTINITATAIVAASSYVLLIAILNNWIAFGAPTWKGFLLQVYIHFIFSVVPLLIVIVPTWVILIKIRANERLKNTILYASIFLILFVIYGFNLSVDGFWLGIFMPCFMGIISFSVINYLTSCSKGTTNRSFYSRLAAP